eukprot:9108155-Alexandrium_andersonii.AAC.1
MGFSFVRILGALIPMCLPLAVVGPGRVAREFNHGLGQGRGLARRGVRHHPAPEDRGGARRREGLAGGQ